MFAELTDPLWNGDPEPLRAWLDRRGVDTRSLWRLPRWNTEPIRDGVPSGRRPPDRLAQAAAEVSAQLPKVTDEPGGVPLLLLYLVHEVAEAWETSYHFSLLWDTLRGARGCVRDHWTPRHPADGTAADAALRLMDTLDARITAENAMASGLFTALAEATDSAVAHAREAAALAAELPAEYAGVREYVTRVADRDTAHGTATALAARAAEAFLRDGTPPDSAIEALAAAEDDDRIDRRHRSELRAHRFSLAALSRDAGRDWLRLDRGTVVYLYPFSLRGVSPEEAVECAVREAAGWRLAGAGAVQVHHSLDLDDVWDGADSLGRRYEGASVHLPEVAVRGLDGAELARLRAEIRFSRLGNHCVRFETEAEDLSPAGLHALMFRAAPEHGAGRVVFSGGAGDGGAGAAHWPRLSDLALQLALDTAEGLRAADGFDRVRAVARPGMFHVVVSVDEASVVPGPRADPSSARREVTTPEELAAAAGAQVLTSPVPNFTGAVAEWSRYVTGEALSSDFVNVTGNRVLTTCNTTVLVGFGTADFVMKGDRAMAEFAASLEGLFAGWSDELADHYRKIRELQARVAGDGRSSAGADVLADLSRELDAEKIRLDEFAIQARSTMALIRSPSLLSSPVAAHTLERMLDASGYPKRVDELVHRIEEVAHEQLGVVVDKIAGQRREQESRAEAEAERRRRNRLDTLLAVIAAIGISGLGQIFQSGYEVKDWGAWGIIVVVLTLAVVAGWVFRRVTDERTDGGA
ncbi:hypothetical protein GCM10010420_09970 [Streptomyces glaucosporus]|uniref:Uncharacterized protein n=1 Tax=Streptomyces glaucosporus TaxID=284044 RepID=A0ABP5UVB6_9ACTN